MRYWMLLCLSFCGCLGINTTRKLTNKVKTAFTNKLEGGVTSLSDRIDINGYYRYWNRNEWGGYESIASSKDTAYIDMIFFDDHWQIVLMELNLQPKTFPKIYGSQIKSRYVLEINSGEALAHNLQVGDQAIFLNK